RDRGRAAAYGATGQAHRGHLVGAWQPRCAGGAGARAPEDGGNDRRAGGQADDRADAEVRGAVLGAARSAADRAARGRSAGAGAAGGPVGSRVFVDSPARERTSRTSQTARLAIASGALAYSPRVRNELQNRIPRSAHRWQRQRGQSRSAWS